MNPLRLTILLLLVCGAVGALFFSFKKTEEPSSQQSVHVVVSIPPLYALAARVMEGVATPDLLMDKQISPHDFSIKPSDRAKLAKANIVFWVGPRLEQGLTKALSTLSPAVTVISFLEEKDLTFYPLDSHHGHSHAHVHQEGVDPHIWLDPLNGLKMAYIIRDSLVARDPSHKEIYHKNTQQLETEIRALDTSLRELLTGGKDIPFAVFHNAYQYFQKRYDLGPAYALTLTPEHALSIKQLSRLESKMKKRHIKCLFAEPQFPQKALETIAQRTNARLIILDPLGHKNISYVELLSTLGQTIHQCATPSQQRITR